MLRRRSFMQIGAGLLGSSSLPIVLAQDEATATTLNQRPIPATGERLPVIGMGTASTFDTSDDEDDIANLRAIMNAFLEGGGTVIDSSPMYGKAESRVGDVLRLMPEQPKLFVATKVWTKGREKGVAQMEESAQRMNVHRFDLIAVHNLKDWKTHLETLQAWKAEGRVRYIGITTSHGRDHKELAGIMAEQAIDFVQFSYNIMDRAAEASLLPLAMEKGIATMINRPYQRGDLFKKSKKEPLPAVAADLDCTSWGQFYLKFILGHPGVTTVIPATSSPRHMTDNMQANFGPLPDRHQRREMLRAFTAL